MKFNPFKPVYAIAAKSATEVDILLYGMIGDSFWSEGNSGKKFVTDFAALEAKYDRINVRINSPGGDVSQGLPMFNAIKSSKKDTHTYVDGIAYSMGAMIALAGKTVHAAKGSLLLLHCVSGIAMGNAKDLRDQADDMDVYDEVLGQLIADKTGKSVAQVKKDWMNHDDHLMSATTAFENKLVDVVETYDAQDMPENIKNLSHGQLLAYYRPQNSGLDPEAITAVATQVSQIIKENDMLGFNRFPSLNALKGKKAAEVTAAEVLAANKEIVDEGLEGVTLVLDSAMETANNSAGQNTAALTAINAVLGADKQQTTLAGAITALIAMNATSVNGLTTMTTDRDAWKLKAEIYGKQPGALPTAPVAEKDADGKVVETTVLDAVVENKFETSVDREVAARAKARQPLK